MSSHALLSASSCSRWSKCPGSLFLSKDIPDKTSEFAQYGTAGHELAALLLENKVPPQYATAREYVGMFFAGVQVDNEMADAVQEYVDFVRSIVGDGTLMVEKRVNYSEFIGQDDAFGTADAIIINSEGDEVIVCDLKMGRGVRVHAEENRQLMLYCLGALDELSVIYGNIKTVRMIIHQPRLGHISEWDCSIEHLMDFSHEIAKAADIAIDIYNGKRQPVLTPGEDQCRFCPAKATCPALSKFVQDTVGGGFEDISNADISDIVESVANASAEDLSLKMRAIGLIEDWCKAVRAQVEIVLFAGGHIEGFKLVEGRKGARAWADKTAAEELLKSFRLPQDVIYDFSLISPTTAEKVLKDSPVRWKRVEELITRKDGTPSVAPASDKRPALVARSAEDFDNVNNEGE